MSNVYESAKLLDEYLLFHYGSEAETLPADAPVGQAAALHFAVRTVVENVPARARARALDLGCAVGRSSFELSAFCDEVIGIDYSHAFIAAAQRLREAGEVAYHRQDEGRLHTRLVARRPAGRRPDRIVFEQGDAHDLRADLGSFELVHAANLICRLREPARLLGRLASMVRPGGTLVLTTPCTWLGEFTPPENWPPGCTLEWLREHLEPAFALEAVRDQAFLIRETARKFQWSVAEASVWARRG
ncbi:MAG: putative 4-mercaptohistidine N1-methyltransferase [Verrucomicrobiales bacterium]